MEYDAEAQIKIGEFEYVKVCKSVETIEAAADLGRELQNEWHGGSGITDDAVNDALDTYLTTGKGELDLYNRMNKMQQYVFQSIKRSLKRRKGYKLEDKEN
jgi:hypothetical protein